MTPGATILRPRWVACAMLVAVLGSGCGEKPEAAYNRIVFHAKMGNEEAFLEGFTEESRRLIRTLLALRRTYGDLVSRDADPYLSLVLEEIESVDVEEKEMQAEDGVEMVERKVAVLTVTDGQIRRKIRMIQFEDGWKIDALDLQKMWADDRKTFRDR